MWNSANFFKFQELIAVLRTGDYFGEAPRNASANPRCTLLETNMSPPNASGKMIFLFQRWNMLLPWRVIKYEVKFMVWNRRNSLSLSQQSPRITWGSKIPKPSDWNLVQTPQSAEIIVTNLKDFREQVDLPSIWVQQLGLSVVSYHLITCVYFVVLHFGQTYHKLSWFQEVIGKRVVSLSVPTTIKRFETRVVKQFSFPHFSGQKKTWRQR